MNDKALETVCNVIVGLVRMQKECSFLDFADLKTMFERRPDGTPRIWYVGEGTASGDGRALEASRLAAADLETQVDEAGPQGRPG